MGQISSSPSVIKSVQRGTITCNSGTNGMFTATATIAAVDTSKAELAYLGYNSEATAGAGIPSIVLLNSTTVEARWIGITATSLSGRVSFQVTERW